MTVVVAEVGPLCRLERKQSKMGRGGSGQNSFPQTGPLPSLQGGETGP